MDEEKRTSENNQPDGNEPAKKKRVWVILAVLCGCVAAGSLGYIGIYVYNSVTHKNMDKKMIDLYDSIPPEMPSVISLEPTPGPAGAAETGLDEPAAPKVTELQKLLQAERAGRMRFNEFLEINEDFLGMLIIDGEGLDIKQPYVWYPDNAKYLKTNFEGKKSNHGCLFLHGSNSRYLLNRNNVIFGHKMHDGTMFAPLLKYSDPAVVERAPLVVLDSLWGKTTWLIFAAYTCEPDYGYVDTLLGGEEFEELLEEIKERSLVNTNVDVNADDRILSLSTCDYDFEDGRFVVHARLLREGENIPETKAVKNPEPKPPVVPKQLSLDKLPAKQTAILRHPGTGKIYYYQSRGSGVNWYVGDTTNVQGPYSSFTGNLNPDSTLSVAFDSGQKTPFMAIDRMSNTPGIFLMSAKIAGGTFRLVKNTPVTPAGVDARYPLLTISSGEMWLFYTVTDDERERIFRLRVTAAGEAAGEPQPLWDAPANTGLRAVSYFVVDGSHMLVWQQSDGVYAAHIRADETVNKKLPFEQWDRVTLYGALASGKQPMLLERGGKLSVGSFLMEWLPASSETSPSETSPPESGGQPAEPPPDAAGDDPEPTPDPTPTPVPAESPEPLPEPPLDPTPEPLPEPPINDMPG